MTTPGPAPEAFHECQHGRCAAECSFPAGELRWCVKGRGAGWWCPECADRSGGAVGPTLAAVLASRAVDPDALAERLRYLDEHLPAGVRIGDALADAFEAA